MKIIIVKTEKLTEYVLENDILVKILSPVKLSDLKKNEITNIIPVCINIVDETMVKRNDGHLTIHDPKILVDDIFNIIGYWPEKSYWVEDKNSQNLYRILKTTDMDIIKKYNDIRPSSYHENEDRCPSCGDKINIDIDLNNDDKCWSCRPNNEGPEWLSPLHSSVIIDQFNSRYGDVFYVSDYIIETDGVISPPIYYVIFYTSAYFPINTYMKILDVDGVDDIGKIIKVESVEKKPTLKKYTLKTGITDVKLRMKLEKEDPDILKNCKIIQN